MAYFSNGTEGEVLDRLCLDCIHGWDGENERQGKPCIVLMLQMQWNYSQLDREKHGTIEHEYTREAIIRKQALDALVPNHTDELCAMFVAVEVD